MQTGARGSLDGPSSKNVTVLSHPATGNYCLGQPERLVYEQLAVLRRGQLESACIR
jgi:hypothetical protein